MIGKKKTTQEFVQEAKQIHGSKYDYSKVFYEKGSKKVCIICPEHGEFWQTPNGHLNGYDCPKCGNLKNANKRRQTKEQFILRAREVHGWRYDYSKVEYKGANTKVCIICPEHGEFWQTPSGHLLKKGCPECNIKKKLSNEEVIKRFMDVHGTTYDYSKVEYKNIDTPVCIICPKHGEFWQTPHGHIRGNNCQKCAKNSENEKKYLSQDLFLERSHEIHGEKYDYSKAKYKSINEAVCIICPKHGEFWQTPYQHLRGSGCQKCRTSHLERKIQLFLDKYNVKYIYQYYPDFLKSGKHHQSLDFYLPSYNMAIECQGAQHYAVIKSWGDEDGLKKRIELDKKKLEECEKNGIKIIYYSSKKYNTDIITTQKELIEILKLQQNV